MPFREWIHSAESNLEMENGEEGTVNDTDLCRGHVPCLCAARPSFIGMTQKRALLSFSTFLLGKSQLEAQVSFLMQHNTRLFGLTTVQRLVFELGSRMTRE